MGIFSLPPAPPRADLDLESLLRGDAQQTPVRRFKRTLPAEWFPQSGVQIAWPHAQTDWAPMLDEVEEVYVRMAYEIAVREPLLIVTPEADDLRRRLEARLPRRATENMRFAACPTNDTWARDHAFLSVVGTGPTELFDFAFNGWGGKFEAALDNAINRRVYDAGFLKGTYVDRLDFVLEGGSIESDGCGTLLTTSACLLNPNRNPALTKEQIELRLQEDFGAVQVLWLDHGALAGDDTDSHIDTLARFCPDNRIAYVACDDPADAHYEPLRLMVEKLRTFRNADGAPYELVPLPWPAAVEFDGERLPATYANFLILNRAVLLPTYRQPERDEAAKRVLQSLFRKYDIVPIDAVPLIKQHGSVHCSCMQYPKGVFAITK